MNPATIICIVIIISVLGAMGMISIYKGCNESIKAIEQKIQELKEKGRKLRAEWLMLKNSFEKMNNTSERFPQMSPIQEKDKA